MGKADAGLYYLAVKMLLFPLSSINSVLSRVLFPLFAKIQDDDDRLRNAFLKVTATIAMLVLPFVVGFAVLAEPIVAGILPERWLPVIPLVTALAVVALMQSLTTSVGNIYLAKGRTDLLLIWGIGACVACVAAFAVGLQYGTIGVARAYAVIAVVLFLPALVLPLRLIRTPLRSFGAVVWRPRIAAVVMGGVVAGAGTLFEAHALIDLAIRVPLGIAIYVGLTLRLNRDHVDQVLMLLRTRKEGVT
jgi:PST family polysaccharide transporter